VIANRQSGGSAEINADFDAVGDGDGGDVLDLAGCALQVDVALINCHLPVIEGLGTLTARGTPAADAEVLVGETHGARDLHGLGLGVADELVGHLLDSVEAVAAEGDSGPLDLLVLDAFFLVLVSHSGDFCNYY
jgi:hypothetical protein